MTRSAGLVLLSAVLGCGAAPIAPDATPLVPFHAGRHMLSLMGFDTSSDPAVPACAGRGLPREGKSLTVLLDLAREGGEWVGRAANATGDLVLRIRESAAELGRIDVSGSITGSAIDSGSPVMPARTVRITFTASNGALPSIEGRGERVAPFALGWIHGAAQFSNLENEQANCTAVSWTLQPN